MAQIIQHKRGVLEDLSGVTANKGELLVVTGSTISALADGLVFVGNHSDLTSVNKILTGSSSPNMTSYDSGVNGLPFYNTTDKKLQILRNDGAGNYEDITNFIPENATQDAYLSRLQWNEAWQLIDMNNDGHIDIAGSRTADENYNNAPIVYFNDGIPRVLIIAMHNHIDYNFS